MNKWDFRPEILATGLHRETEYRGHWKNMLWSVRTARKGDLRVTFVALSGSVTHQRPRFDWRLWAHTKAPYEFKNLSTKKRSGSLRVRHEHEHIWSHFRLKREKRVLSVVTISLCRIYTNSLPREDVSFGHAKQEYKNKHGIFPSLQYPQSSPHAPFAATWRLSKRNGREKHEAGNELEAWREPEVFPMRSTGQEEASRANKQHNCVISKSSALNILVARGRAVDSFGVQSCHLQLGVCFQTNMWSSFSLFLSTYAS